MFSKVRARWTALPSEFTEATGLRRTKRSCTVAAPSSATEFTTRCFVPRAASAARASRRSLSASSASSIILNISSRVGIFSTLFVSCSLFLATAAAISSAVLIADSRRLLNTWLRSAEANLASNLLL